MGMPGALRNIPDVCGGEWNLVRAEVFDKRVAIRMVGVKQPQRVRQVQFAKAWDGFIEMDDETVCNADILDMADRRQRADGLEYMVQAFRVVMDLIDGFEVIDVVHHQPDVRAAHRIHQPAADVQVY